MKTSKKRYQEEELVGLDINNGQLAAAHFSRTGRGLKFDRLVTSEYDPQISDRQLAAGIRAFWKKEKLPSHIVRTCIYSRSLLVRYFQYSNLNENELAMALSLEAEEALQLPSSEICIDWNLNPVVYHADGNPEQLCGTLVAAPRKAVKRHLDLICAAGLYSVNVEVSCSAAYNLYSYLFEKQERPPMCLVHIAQRTADIIMCADDSIYPRTLFSANDCWETNTEYLLENIQNALLYYHLKIRHGAIGKVVLFGRIPASDQFLEKLARKVSLPVETVDVCAHLGLGENHPGFRSGCNATTAIGLALQEAEHEPL
jgi:Tfp pilus assembly PilM family ATPase